MPHLDPIPTNGHGQANGQANGHANGHGGANGDGQANGRGQQLDLQRSGDRWLRWLNHELDRRAETPMARLLGLWDVLEEWFATDGFHASLPARAAGALLAEPGDPVGIVVAEHRRAVRCLLEELAGEAGANDPSALGAQLHVLLEGAIAAALMDRRPGAARTARALAAIAIGEDAA